MKNEFQAGLEDELIHFRDRLQFELKSEFELKSKQKNTTFTQEFYIFVPDSLQINPQTYSTQQFYRDETNLVRYKTPTFSFDELLNPANLRSPLNRLHSLAEKVPFSGQQDLVSDEAKLFGNILRSTLREATFDLVQELQNPNMKEQISSKMGQLCENVQETECIYRQIQSTLVTKSKDLVITRNLGFVDEFICDTVDYFLTGLLDAFRNSEYSSLSANDKELCDLILTEKTYKEEHFPPDPVSEESILYRQSLLQKFLMESLQLKSNRVAIAEKHGPFIGALAAGLAMLVYMALFLFVWKTPALLINSIPFILSVVIFYILKDRVKEGLKSYYKQQAFKWFPDYRTEIFSQHDKPIGVLSESVSFTSLDHLPTRIQRLRSQESNTLDKIQRHETVLLYKREVELYPNPERDSARRHHINTIFRFNIRHFLEKASEPTTLQLDLDPKTTKIHSKELPKVYHINIILKSIHIENEREISEIQKYCIIINKEGIKRVEYLDRS